MFPQAQIQLESLRKRMFANRKIRCVLVHDHVLLRQGLRRMLADEPDVVVVAEAGSVAEARHRVVEHQPELVIADAGLFERAGEHSERPILQESPHTKILFLTTNEHDDLTVHERGAASRTGRRTSVEELVEMIRKANSARTAAVREMPRHLRTEWPNPDLAPRQRVLTAREREVLKLLAEGRTVRSAAAVLGLSVKTVDAHKFNLMRKLGIHNKAELVMWAIQNRVVKLPANF